MWALVLVLAVLCIACVGVAIWVVVEMKKEKRELERKWRRMYKKGTATMDSKLDRHMSEIKAASTKKDAELKRALVGIDKRVGTLADTDAILGRQVQTVKQGMMMMHREDQLIKGRLAALSDKDDAFEKDVMSMRPFLDVAQVDKDGIQFGKNVNLGKDGQFCIDSQCLSSQDIAKMRAPQTPPIGSVWRCSAVQVDMVDPTIGKIPPFPVTFRIEDNTYQNSVPSYPLSMRFTEIMVQADFQPIPIEADPTNSSKSNAATGTANFYPYVDINPRNVAVSQRIFPLTFNGYGMGATCRFNIIGIFTLEDSGTYMENAPAIFTRIA